MAGDDDLLKPTLHVEVRLKSATLSQQQSRELCNAVKYALVEDFAALEVGQTMCSLEVQFEENICCIEIADYTGPASISCVHQLADVDLDVQCYVLKPERESDPRRRVKQLDEDHMSYVKVLALPNHLLHETWSSLVFEDALPARLLRYLVRMVDMMSRPDLNLSAFNWNRLCLLHGPPGSGKSTLCRALAQKLSIRLGNLFDKAMFVEVNTNSMLSKYFGESGKQIGSMFEHVYIMCQDRRTLVCVVMDEIETIAGSRERAAEGAECGDGLRATNQLLTALDRLRNLPNVIILCTSNLIEAIDPAFLDRVDVKQYIPCPSPSAIYNIFRSCMNELIRSQLVEDARADAETSLEYDSTRVSSTSVADSPSPNKPRTRTRAKTAVRSSNKDLSTSSSQNDILITAGEAITIPTFTEMKARSQIHSEPSSPGQRVWALSQRCYGLSGRTLRRLPILGLAIHTWRRSSLDDAVSALEKAVEQELAVIKGQQIDQDTKNA